MLADFHTFYCGADFAKFIIKPQPPTLESRLDRSMQVGTFVTLREVLHAKVLLCHFAEWSVSVTGWKYDVVLLGWAVILARAVVPCELEVFSKNIFQQGDFANFKESIETVIATKIYWKAVLVCMSCW